MVAAGAVAAELSGRPGATLQVTEALLLLPLPDGGGLLPQSKSKPIGEVSPQTFANPNVKSGE